MVGIIQVAMAACGIISYSFSLYYFGCTYWPSRFQPWGLWEVLALMYVSKFG
jgi:hypothetical protein